VNKTSKIWDLLKSRGEVWIPGEEPSVSLPATPTVTSFTPTESESKDGEMREGEDRLAVGETVVLTDYSPLAADEESLDPSMP